MTLTEYLVDYASEETKKVGFELIERELKRYPRIRSGRSRLRT